MRGIQVNGQKINCISILGNYVLCKHRAVGFRSSSPCYPLSLGTPEGTRYIMVSIPSSRNRATVHRTVAFDCSSPFLCIRIKDAVDVSSTASFINTPEGTRTPNPRNRNPMLYPLSHRCICSLNIIAGFSTFVKRGDENIFLFHRHFCAKVVVFFLFLCYNPEKHRNYLL